MEEEEEEEAPGMSEAALAVISASTGWDPPTSFNFVEISISTLLALCPTMRNFIEAHIRLHPRRSRLPKWARLVVPFRRRRLDAVLPPPPSLPRPPLALAVILLPLAAEMAELMCIFPIT